MNMLISNEFISRVFVMPTRVESKLNDLSGKNHLVKKYLTFGLDFSSIAYISEFLFKAVLSQKSNDNKLIISVTKTQREYSKLLEIIWFEMPLSPF